MNSHCSILGYYMIPKSGQYILPPTSNTEDSRSAFLRNVSYDNITLKNTI